jgi:hypothetical protein
VRIVIDCGGGENIVYFCGENTGNVFYGAFDVECTVSAVDILDRDNDLCFSLEFLLFFLFHNSLTSKDWVRATAKRPAKIKVRVRVKRPVKTKGQGKDAGLDRPQLASLP